MRLLRRGRCAAELADARARIAEVRVRVHLDRTRLHLRRDCDAIHGTAAWADVRLSGIATKAAWPLCVCAARLAHLDRGLRRVAWDRPRWVLTVTSGDDAVAAVLDAFGPPAAAVGAVRVGRGPEGLVAPLAAAASYAWTLRPTIDGSWSAAVVATDALLDRVAERTIATSPNAGLGCRRLGSAGVPGAFGAFVGAGRGVGDRRLRLAGQVAGEVLSAVPVRTDGPAGAARGALRALAGVDDGDLDALADVVEALGAAQRWRDVSDLVAAARAVMA